MILSPEVLFMFKKILLNILTLGVPAIIEAAAKAKREKREQEHRHRMESGK